MKAKRTKRKIGRIVGNWQYINGSGWAHLLAHRPQFADRCDWSKLNGDDWLDLLEVSPEFIYRCDWSTFRGEDIMRLVCQSIGGRTPSLLSRLDDCDLSRLSAHEWPYILALCPELADRFEAVRRDWSQDRVCDGDFDNLDLGGERKLSLD